MDSTAVMIMMIVVGIPVIAGVGAGVIHQWMKTRLRHSEIELERQKLATDQQLRMDELNAKIIKMDDLGLSPADTASLVEDVRRLREEVSQLRRELADSRTIGQR